MPTPKCNTFVQIVYIQLIKSDSKDIYTLLYKILPF